MEYMIRDKIGINAITAEDGQRVYDAIYPILHQQQVVELDFEGVKIVASPFLNIAVGQLLRDFMPEQLNRYLKFKNVPPITRPIIKIVIENAKIYYSNPEFRQDLATILQKEAEGDNDF